MSIKLSLSFLKCVRASLSFKHQLIVREHDNYKYDTKLNDGGSIMTVQIRVLNSFSKILSGHELCIPNYYVEN